MGGGRAAVLTVQVALRGGVEVWKGESRASKTMGSTSYQTPVFCVSEKSFISFLLTCIS